MLPIRRDPKRKVRAQLAQLSSNITSLCYCDMVQEEAYQDVKELSGLPQARSNSYRGFEDRPTPAIIITRDVSMEGCPSNHGGLGMFTAYLDLMSEDTISNSCFITPSCTFLSQIPTLIPSISSCALPCFFSFAVSSTQWSL